MLREISKDEVSFEQIVDDGGLDHFSPLPLSSPYLEAGGLACWGEHLSKDFAERSQFRVDRRVP